MTWVKICGITNLEDALLAVEAGADALGFVFHERSPRKVDVETARAIVAELPARVEKVGVFVGQTVEHASAVLEEVALTTAQVHARSFDEWFSWSALSERKLILAVPGDLVTSDYLVQLGPREKPISAVLVDSLSNDQAGGTGKAFDWQAAKLDIWALGAEVPVVVAGGLTPENVTKAIEVLRPFGVDVASGVEARPGKKDPEKVRAFVKAVREADRKVS